MSHPAIVGREGNVVLVAFPVVNDVADMAAIELIVKIIRMAREIEQDRQNGGGGA